MTGKLGLTKYFHKLNIKYILVFLVIAFFVLVKFFFFDIYFLKNLEEKNENIGYLYKFSDLKSEEKYMLVSDTPLKDENVNKEVFAYEYLDQGYLWNPKSCAKMPSVIDKNGNIYMIDVVYENEKFVKKFVYFNALTKVEKYLDINSKVILSNLFIENDAPYFFERGKLGIYKSSLVKVVQNNYFPFGIFKYNHLLLETSRDLITARENQNKELIFTRFTKLTKQDKFIFDADKQALVSISSEKDTIPEVNMLKKRKLSNGKLEYRSNENELDYGISDEVGNIDRFLKENKGIYMYIIDSY
jgi:hypothetical protein